MTIAEPSPRVAQVDGPLCENPTAPHPRDLTYAVPSEFRDESSFRVIGQNVDLSLQVAALNEEPRRGWGSTPVPLRGSIEDVARAWCANAASGSVSTLTGTESRVVWACTGTRRKDGRSLSVAFIPAGSGNTVWMLTEYGKESDTDQASFLRTAQSARPATERSVGTPEGYVARVVANVRLHVPSCARENGSSTLLEGPDGSELAISRDEDGTMTTDAVLDKELRSLARESEVMIAERRSVIINGLRGTFVRYNYRLGRTEKPRTQIWAVLSVPGEQSMSIVGRTNQNGDPVRLARAWQSFVSSIRWADDTIPRAKAKDSSVAPTR